MAQFQETRSHIRIIGAILSMKKVWIYTIAVILALVIIQCTNPLDTDTPQGIKKTPINDGIDPTPPPRWRPVNLENSEGVLMLMGQQIVQEFPTLEDSSQIINEVFVKVHQNIKAIKLNISLSSEEIFNDNVYVSGFWLRIDSMVLSPALVTIPNYPKYGIKGMITFTEVSGTGASTRFVNHDLNIGERGTSEYGVVTSNMKFMKGNSTNEITGFLFAKIAHIQRPQKEWDYRVEFQFKHE